MRRAWTLLVAAGLRRDRGQRLGGRSPAPTRSPSPSLFSDVTIAVALVISTLGLLAFPDPRRRGARAVGDAARRPGGRRRVPPHRLRAGLHGAAQLVGTRGHRAQVFALIFPVLDVVLATVAVLLVVRASRADRLMLVLVASAFLLYAASDLAFAVLTAKGTSTSGPCSTSGGSSGYLTLGLAASVRTREARARGPARREGPSDALGTTPGLRGPRGRGRGPGPVRARRGA